MVLVSVIPATPLLAQTMLTENTLKLDENSPAAVAHADSFRWLVGYWVGSGLGGSCEESWLPAMGRSEMGASMIGTFRLLKDDQLVFTEFFQLSREESGWTLRLKHFDPKLRGWEAKDEFSEFRLIRAEPNAVYFDGLTYRLTEQGQLHVFVAMRQKDSSFREAKFEFHRRSLTPLTE